MEFFLRWRSKSEDSLNLSCTFDREIFWEKKDFNSPQRKDVILIWIEIFDHEFVEYFILFGCSESNLIISLVERLANFAPNCAVIYTFLELVFPLFIRKISSI